MERLQVLRRVRCRLPAGACERLDATGSLCEQVDQLKPAWACERLAHQRDRLEQDVLSAVFHSLLFNRTIDNLSRPISDLEVEACISDSYSTTRAPAPPTCSAARPTASLRSWIHTWTSWINTSRSPRDRACRSWRCSRPTCRPTTSPACPSSWRVPARAHTCPRGREWSSSIARSAIAT